VNPRFGLTNRPTALLRFLKMPCKRIDRRVVVTNIPKTLIRCARRMPGFDSFWLSYRTASAETSIIQGDAASIDVVRWFGKPERLHA
jgi:hypothetical protein